MNNNILIVSTSEGFMVKGLETKLKGINVSPLYSAPKVKELGQNCSGAGLVIIFTDDDILMMPEALVYIKDYCAEKDIHVIVIGKKEEYEKITKYISPNLVHKFYERPLDMDALLNDVEKYMEAEAEYARKRSILIVDDDVSYMSMIADWLKSEYRVSMANSGMEAIMWLSKNRADLILLDYEMPITPGPQVLEMIRSNVETADTPVMFLTGKGDKESIMKVLALKPVGYLLKTVDRNTLKESIANYFASKKG